MKNTKNMVTTAILTAMVIILQLLGSFIKFGPFSISLVLMPIVLGAALCGTKSAGWLGFVFGIIVLMRDAGLFLAVSVWGTVLTVLAKGIACGLVAGICYNALKKISVTFAVFVASLVCPIVNTGIFLIGCGLFFMPLIGEWAAAAGSAVLPYMLVSFVGANFVLDVVLNVVFCPIIISLFNAVQKA